MIRRGMQTYSAGSANHCFDTSSSKQAKANLISCQNSDLLLEKDVAWATPQRQSAHGL